jgi:predicted ATPase/DNA-binding SARP family transcriptional activator
MSRSTVDPRDRGLSLWLFGPFQAEIGGAPLPRLRTRSVGWLLSLLALHAGRELSRSWLAGTLWPDSSEERARYNLRRDLVELRRALGPEAVRLIATTSRTLSLDLNGAAVDLLAFDEAIARASRRIPPREGEEALREAVALYRGPLLEGCGEEWVTTPRAARAAACESALDRLAGFAFARGEPGEAVRWLREAERLDPFRDSVQRDLMRALAEVGDLAAALLVYRGFCDRLHRELSAQPSPETIRLFHSIRARLRHAARLTAGREVAASPPGIAPPPPASAPARSLPQPLTPLVGRHEELDELRECWLTRRLVTLTGPGGVGKTRLALAVASDRETEFAGGAVLVELAPLADPARLAQHVAAALGLRDDEEPPAGNARAAAPATGGVHLAALSARLGERPLLLLLDNCEHLARACAVLVDHLLRRCPSLHVLATSRQPLGLTGEIVWRVPPLAVPALADLKPEEKDPVDLLLQFPAARLFVERAAAARPAFRLTGANAQWVAQICHRLDGLPLALELAAARLRALSAAQVAARLEDRFNLLTGGDAAAFPRHQTLRALIDWSYDLLSAREQALFRQLAVFSGGWTLEAAEAVCGSRRERESAGSDDAGPPHPLPRASILPPPVLDTLTALVDRSMVAIEERDGHVRFRMLETIRDYALEKLRGAGEETNARARHLVHFLAVAEAADGALTGPGRAAGLAAFAADHDNLRAALDFCLEGDERADSEHAAPVGAENSTLTAGKRDCGWPACWPASGR